MDDSALDVRVTHLEKDVDVLKIDISDNKKKIVDIRLDMRDLAVVKKLVFGAVGLVLVQFMTALVGATIWFMQA